MRVSEGGVTSGRREEREEDGVSDRALEEGEEE